MVMRWKGDHEGSQITNLSGSRWPAEGFESWKYRFYTQHNKPTDVPSQHLEEYGHGLVHASVEVAVQLPHATLPK
jgi:hypothetical protein